MVHYLLELVELWLTLCGMNSDTVSLLIEKHLPGKVLYGSFEFGAPSDFNCYKYPGGEKLFTRLLVILRALMPQ